jgi:hypothetical protein
LDHDLPADFSQIAHCVALADWIQQGSSFHPPNESKLRAPPCCTERFDAHRRTINAVMLSSAAFADLGLFQTARTTYPIHFGTLRQQERKYHLQAYLSCFDRLREGHQES